MPLKTKEWIVLILRSSGTPEGIPQEEEGWKDPSHAATSRDACWRLHSYKPPLPGVRPSESSWRRERKTKTCPSCGSFPSSPREILWSPTNHLIAAVGLHRATAKEEGTRTWPMLTIFSISPARKVFWSFLKYISISKPISSIIFYSTVQTSMSLNTRFSHAVLTDLLNFSSQIVRHSSIILACFVREFKYSNWMLKHLSQICKILCVCMLFI